MTTTRDRIQARQQRQALKTAYTQLLEWARDADQADAELEQADR